MGDKMKRVTILALHLGCGEIERAITDLANSLVNDYLVEIVSTYKVCDKPINRLDRKVKVNYLTELKPNSEELRDAIRKFRLISIFREGFKRIKILKLKKELMINYIKECDSDVIISTRNIHNKWLGLYGNSNSMKIGWEHNYNHKDDKYISNVIDSVSNLDCFVVVSKDFYNLCKNNIKSKCFYIPNLVSKSLVHSDLKEKNLISVCRFPNDNGHLELIDVFSLVHMVYPDWKLYIVGNGMDKDKMIQKIRKYDLFDSVFLCGDLDNEHFGQFLSKSSVYITTSYFSPLGTDLLEAFSYGIPCVAFDSADDACELISNNWDGYLIKDHNYDEMAKRICHLIDKYPRRYIMGQNGLKKANKYSLEDVRNKWIKVIK